MKTIFRFRSPFPEGPSFSLAKSVEALLSVLDKGYLFSIVCLSLFTSLVDASGENLPDLVVQSVKVQPDHPTEAQGIALIATVKNQGTAPTPPNASISVRFYDISGNAPSRATQHKPTMWTHLNGSLAPGEAKEISTNPSWFPDAGTYTILAEVNYTKEIRESDRTNNSLSSPVTIFANDPLRAQLGPATPSTYQPSANEIIVNGNMPSLQQLPTVVPTEDPTFGIVDGTVVLKATRGFVLGDSSPERFIAGAEYVFSCRIKCLGVEPPDKPLSIQIFLRNGTRVATSEAGFIHDAAKWTGTFNWKRFERRFPMPNDICQWQVYANGDGTYKATAGWSFLTDLSLRPVDDVDMNLDPHPPMLAALIASRWSGYGTVPPFPGPVRITCWEET